MASGELQTLNPFMFPQIVEKIFQSLSAKSLSNVSSVCKLWQSEAARVLQQRKQFSWEQFVSTPDNSVDFIFNAMHQYFKELPFRPKFVLVFHTRGSWRCLRLMVCKRKRGREESANSWKRLCFTTLPNDCQVSCNITTGIVGTKSDGSQTEEHEDGICASVVCFGSFPGVDVSLSKTICARSEVIQNPENIKLVLLLTGFHASHNTAAYLRKKLPTTLITGAVVEQTSIHCVHPAFSAIMTEHRISNSKPYCVTFRGEGIQVASIKLSSRINKPTSVEAYITKLKERTQDFVVENSLAFMFACVARGHKWYEGKHNVESSIFRKHFPNIPLIGMFGNGEVGCDFPFSDNMPELFHSYTTLMVVVSFP